jgi:hypothetical protein
MFKLCLKVECNTGKKKGPKMGPKYTNIHEYPHTTTHKVLELGHK